MANENLYSFDNLNNNPSFNFSNSLFNSDYLCEDANSPDDSPYSNLDILCNYFDENQFVSKFSGSNNFNLFSLNIQSLPSKYNALQDLINNFNINNCQPDVLCIQETWQVPDPSLFPLINYNQFICNLRSNSIQGGGVGFYFKNNLRFKILTEKSIFIDRVFESIFAEVWINNNKKVVIGNVYRPSVNHPTLSSSQQFDQFFEMFSNLLNDFSCSNTQVIIVGDFNLDALKYNLVNQVTEYIDLLFSYGFLQLIMKPTRCTPHSASLIDHVLTNTKSDVFETAILTSDISDHFPFIFFSKICSHPQNNKLIKFRDFSDLNVKKFTSALRSINWDFLNSFDGTQDAYDHFSETFFTLYNLYFPECSKYLNKNLHSIFPWMTKGLLVSRSRKILLHKISLKNPSPNSVLIYKNFRNFYAKVLKASKKLYFQNQLLKHQSDCKKTWEILRKAINNSNKSNNSIQSIIHNGVSTDDSFTMAEKFNEFFANIALKIVEDVHPVSEKVTTSPPKSAPSFSFNFSDDPLTPSEIQETIELLQNKKTVDSDGISSAFIKKISLTISKPLQIIFSKSFSDGVIPQQFKQSKIIPLFKSGDRTCMDNYRPIALLSTFSKILEKIVCKRLSNFLENNELLSQFQFGFRKEHSTIHPMVHFMNKITNALENKMHTIAIFCDLRKAFDSCNHNILLNKLRGMGLSGTELLWFENYLTNRQQYVFLNGASSSFLSTRVGVPQGSILGPLLFLIYINDLPGASNLLTLLFADDTTLLFSHSDIVQLVTIVNEEFRKVVKFFRKHELSLHPLKTKFMLFSNSQPVKNLNIEIFLNSNNENENDPSKCIPILRVLPSDDVPAVRFLGVFFDPNLNFQFHIKTISAKLSKALYILRTAKNLLNKKSLKAIYYSIFHCYLIYCVPIWSCCSQKLIKNISLMQKKAIRLVNGSRYNEHTEPIFKELGILPLDKLIEFFNLQFMQNFIQGLLPISFNNVWTTNEARRPENSHHILRNSSDLTVPFTRLASLSKHPLVNLPKTWLEFKNENVKILRNKIDFKLQLKKHLLSELSSEIFCGRLLCPSCHLNLNA